MCKCMSEAVQLPLMCRLAMYIIHRLSAWLWPSAAAIFTTLSPLDTADERRWHGFTGAGNGIRRVTVSNMVCGRDV